MKHYVAADSEAQERLDEAMEGRDAFHRLHTSFGGVPSAQIWADYFLWELVLNDRPDLVGIIEIGTWMGGFARFLSAQAKLRGMSFVTYDVKEYDFPPVAEFVQADIWAVADVFKAQLSGFPGPIILLCDGGNKPREIKTFGPACPPGSLFVAHDWGFEFLPGHVPEWAVEVYGETCDALGSVSRIFERRSF